MATYEINGREVSKEEYEETMGKVQQIKFQDQDDVTAEKHN